MNLLSKKLLLTLSFCLLNNALNGAAVERAEVKGKAEHKVSKKEQEEINRQFIEAVKLRDLNTVNKLINDVDVNMPNNTGWTILAHIAFLSNFTDNTLYTEIAKLLLNRNADPDIQDIEGMTALMRLLCKIGKPGNPEIPLNILNLLFDFGVDPHLRNSLGKDALSILNSEINYMLSRLDANVLVDEAHARLELALREKQLLEQYIQNYDKYLPEYEKYKQAKIEIAGKAKLGLQNKKFPEELSERIFEFMPKPYMTFREFVRRNVILRERGEQKGQKEKQEKESI